MSLCIGGYQPHCGEFTTNKWFVCYHNVLILFLAFSIIRASSGAILEMPWSVSAASGVTTDGTSAAERPAWPVLLSEVWRSVSRSSRAGANGRVNNVRLSFTLRSKTKIKASSFDNGQ